MRDEISSAKPIIGRLDKVPIEIVLVKGRNIVKGNFNLPLGEDNPKNIKILNLCLDGSLRIRIGSKYYWAIYETVLFLKIFIKCII